MRFESRYVFAVGCMGYAAAQLMFLASTSEVQVIAWRLFSGFFVAMINVSSLVYLVRMSAGDKRARSLIHLATATAVTTALGYTVGGIVGNESYARAFLAQFAALAVAGLLLALLGGDCGTERVGIRRLLRDGNPLRLGSADFRVRRRIVAYLAVVLISMSALTVYEQSLNYYLKDILDFSPADIGCLKGAIGAVTLVSNQVFALRLMRRARLLRHIGVVFALASFVNLLFAAVGGGPAFTALNLEAHQDELVSLYNEMRSVGWVVGGLVAGLAYAVWPPLPFAITVVLFAGLAGLCLYGDRLQRVYQ